MSVQKEAAEAFGKAEVARRMLLNEAAFVTEDLNNAMSHARSLAERRAEVILQLNEAGVPAQEIADAIKVSRIRVYQILQQARLKENA
jgi:DNA-directed RNA polymerase specialized sigma24 family protein